MTESLVECLTDSLLFDAESLTIKVVLAQGPCARFPSSGLAQVSRLARGLADPAFHQELHETKLTAADVSNHYCGISCSMCYVLSLLLPIRPSIW